MDSYMGISDESLRIIEKWEVQRLYGTLEEYENAKKLAERVIELEDLTHTRKSENEVLREEVKSLSDENIALSYQFQGMITQIEYYNKRLIKVRVRSFINRIFAKLGYTQKED